MSPRPRTDRRYIGFKTSPAGFEAIEQFEHQWGVDRTKAVNRLLRDATYLRQTLPDAVQQIADNEGVEWHEAVRRLVSWATEGQTMPEGWH